MAALTQSADQQFQQERTSSLWSRMTMFSSRFAQPYTHAEVPPDTLCFRQLRVDVLESDSLPEVRPYFPGTPLSPPSTATLPYPIVLSARAKHDYFVPRESFNVLAMFKNPMMMMMLGAGVLVLLMPTMMVRRFRLVSSSPLSGLGLRSSFNPRLHGHLPLVCDWFHFHTGAPRLRFLFCSCGWSIW